MKVKNTILQQIFSIPIDKERYLIYAPLKGIAFIGNPSLVNAIFEHCQNIEEFSSTNTNASPDVHNHLNELNFLYRLDFFRPESLPIDEYQGEGVKYDTVILFLTNQCNFRCSYCYASAGEYRAQQMPWDIAKASIDLIMDKVIKNQSPSMSLGFHGGGEPTLNWTILTRAIDYARSLAEKNNIPLHVKGSFNGYWSKKLLYYIIQNFTEVSLSFDGLPFIQNLQRPTKDNKDSSQRVIQTLRALDDGKLPYGIRMTVTNDSVPYLAESVSFICENFRPHTIQVEPVFEVGRARKNRSAIKDLDIFINQFIIGFKTAQKHNITLFYSGAQLDRLTQRFCLAACRALIVTPNGDITTCFEIFSHEHPLSCHFIVGNYKENGEFYIDEESLQHHLRNVGHIPYCDACFCKWHCAGDCAIKTFTEKNNIGFHPTERCFVNRELTKFLIANKIKESGGFIWHKNKQCNNWIRKEDE